MVRIVIAAGLMAAAPLGAQVAHTRAAADRDSILAAALRETPKRDSATARVTRLVVRGDAAEVTVQLFADDRHQRGHQLSLARRDGQWFVLPRRVVFIGHFAPKEPQRWSRFR